MELTFTPKAERFIQRMITFGGGMLPVLSALQ